MHEQAADLSTQQTSHVTLFFTQFTTGGLPGPWALQGGMGEPRRGGAAVAACLLFEHGVMSARSIELDISQPAQIPNLIDLY